MIKNIQFVKQLYLIKVYQKKIFNNKSSTDLDNSTDSFENKSSTEKGVSNLDGTQSEPN